MSTSQTPGHRDFLLEVPAYRYQLPCGHQAFYRIPVPRKGFGFCRTCREPFRHDDSVTEYAPRNSRRRLSDSEIATLVDKAIVRNRIADLLMATMTPDLHYSEQLVYDIARTCGVTNPVVRQVARELGLAPLDLSPSTSNEECAA